MSEASVSTGTVSICGREPFPLTSPMLDDLRPFYARARREEPVFWSESLDLWVVTRYEDVCAVAKNAARFLVPPRACPAVTKCWRNGAMLFTFSRPQTSVSGP